MSEPRKKSEWPIAVVLVMMLLLATPGGYAVCYFAMSELSPSLAAAESNNGPDLVRFYDARWKATIFRPAAKVESLVRGRQVQTLAFSGWEPFEAWKE